MERRRVRTVALLLLLGLTLPGTGRARKTSIDTLEYLPPDADIVLVANTNRLDELLRGWFDDAAGLPLVKKSPWLQQQLQVQWQMLKGGMAALTMQVGIDLFKDVKRVVLALEIPRQGEPDWVITVRGKLPAGLIDRLPGAGERVMLGKLAARRTGDGEFALQPRAGLLLFGNRAGLQAALAGRAGRGRLRRRHPLLAQPLGREQRLRVSFAMPAWLVDAVHGQPDARLGLPLIEGLQRLELEVGQQVILRAQANKGSTAASWRRLLSGLAEMTTGGHHLLRAYAQVMLALDLSALPEVPDQLRPLLADKQLLDRTVEALLPARPRPLRVSRRGLQVQLAGRGRDFAGISFVTGILAAVAVPAFVDYTRKARLSEGYARIKELQAAEEKYRQDHGTYLACGPHPQAVPAGGEPVAWEKDACFEKLGFRPEKTRFSYQVKLVGKGFEIEARADLDGDGRPVTLQALSDGGPVVREPPDEW